jgi:hypothetical protein
MKKEEARKLIEDAGDAIVTYRAENSTKLKYNVVTLNFSGYVSRKKTHAKEEDNTLLTFSWDTDTFRLIRVDLITSIVPLAAVLKNHNV